MVIKRAEYMSAKIPTGLILLALCLLPPPSWPLQLDQPAPSLAGVSIPYVDHLTNGDHPIILNPVIATQLGKALFWDTAVGSDGMACASCHFHAGADRRTRHQLGTGSLHPVLEGKTFQKTASGREGGADYTLQKSDFPFPRFTDPTDKHSTLAFASDDTVSSSGSFHARYEGVDREQNMEKCTLINPTVFHHHGLKTRRTGSRNAPTVINAVFNERNFWDGRASKYFNGENAYGPHDHHAGVWVRNQEGVSKQPLLLDNSALASQAVAPPINSQEMGCEGRLFVDIARKILQSTPLASQQIAADDSVLGLARNSSGFGMATTYESLIRKSFAPRYWMGDVSNDLSMLEANFAFFFGLAIQLYESTLISDQAPFDRPRSIDGFPEGFTDQQKRGHQIFDRAECDFCHRGPAFTLASHPSILEPGKISPPYKPIDRRVLNISESTHAVRIAMIDTGFANTSVTPSDQDPGLGASDPFGHPLSYAEQFRNHLLWPEKPMPDLSGDASFMFAMGFRVDFRKVELTNHQHPTSATALAEMQKPGQGRLSIATQGAFKIPTLRNIELTGPYMHNGSMKDLKEVIDFYDRGGNLENPDHFGTFVFPQHFTPQEKEDLLAFLLTLTDERVRWERAPFDHPSLDIPHGGSVSGDLWPPDRRRSLELHIPAVGKDGRSLTTGPLRPFSDYLD